MNVLRSYRVLRFVLVLTAILAQCVALSSFPLLVIAGTLAAVSWYVTEDPRGRSIPPWVSRLLVFVVILFSAFEAMGPVTLLPLVLGRFVVWLTIIKLYGSRTVENEAQLLLLSLLLMAVGSLYATDFLFGILLILWTGLAAWVMLLYQLHHGIESMRIERYKSVPLHHPAPWTRPVTGLRAQVTFRRTVSLLLIIGGVSSLSFFLVVPRETLEVLPHAASAGNYGQERMELKPDRDIVQSNRQVMSVTLQDVSGQSVHLSKGLRLRGSVLDSYRGNGVWDSGTYLQSTFSTTDDAMVPLTLEGNSRSNLTLKVTLQQPSSKVFALYRPVAIETNPPSRVTMNLATSTMGLGFGAPSLHGYRLDVDLKNIVASPMFRRKNMYHNEEVKSLALQILQDALIDVQDISDSPELSQRAAMAFEKFLRVGKFTYTTDGSTFPLAQRLALEQDNDPIATFLFQHKRGHCEFFAASMVALCDTIELPARIVTGFYVDRWDEVNNQYIVLDRDAHAWVEVETQPLAWMTFDPTPTAVGSPRWQEPMTFAQSLRVTWQRWEMEWETSIVGYDASAQSKLIELADPYWKEHLNNVLTTMKNIFDGVVQWFDIGAGGRLWIDLVMGAAVLSGSAFLFVRWRRRRTSQFLKISYSVDEHLPIASVEFYSRLQRVLAHRGWIRPHHMPTMAWINTLQLDEEVDELATSLTAMYYRIRFGGIDQFEDNGLR